MIEYLACELSNFAVHLFSFDGVEIQSMEGFLQSLKYMNQTIQKKICMMSGKEAKKRKGNYCGALDKLFFEREKKLLLIQLESVK